MRRLGMLLMVLVSACSAGSTTTTVPAPTTLPTVAPTTTLPPTTTTSTVVTTTTAAVTTTTLAPLITLAYEEVAKLDFPVQIVPWTDVMSMIATKDGRVWLYDGTQVSAEPILDISSQVRDSGEQGLLSITVHPDDTSRFFAHYSAEDGDTVVSEFAWENGALGAERALFRLDQPAANHNGGMIQFGPDGRLILGLGDGGGSADRYGNGQNLDTLLGGLVAIDVDDPAVEPELYSHGLRNPWRFWIDGDVIFVADVGQGDYEEVTVTDLRPGVNFGWPITEGNHCFNPSTGCDTTGITLPVVEIEHGDAGTCSITGGVVYHGSEIPELEGTFLFSDYCGGYLRGLTPAMEVVDFTDQVGVAGRVTGFGVGSDGEVYVTTTDRLLRLVAVR